MKCCGHEQTTPFCAYCGEKTGGPLEGLLHHVTSHMRSIQANLAAREAYIAKQDSGAYKERKQAALETTQRRLAKWISWENALTEVVRELPDPD